MFVLVDCRLYFEEKMMKKEIENHIKHLEVTMEMLLTTLYSDDELNLIYQEENHLCENLSMKKSWVKVSNLVVPGVTDKEMVLIHLLWFQSIKRVVIYDADPLSGTVLISLNFDQIKKEPRKS